MTEPTQGVPIRVMSRQDTGGGGLGDPRTVELPAYNASLGGVLPALNPKAVSRAPPGPWGPNPCPSMSSVWDLESTKIILQVQDVMLPLLGLGPTWDQSPLSSCLFLP